MPNPLFRRQLSTSKQPPTRPVPVEPVPEVYEGDNNAYRGTESHGVAKTVEPSPVMGYDANHDGITYMKPERPEHPVPVEIVNEYGEEFRRHRIHKMTVNNDRGLQFIGRNYARTSVIIQNRDPANSIYLYHAPIDPANGALIGFEIAAKEEVTLTSQAAIYVVGSNVAYCTVQAIEHYSVAK